MATSITYNHGIFEINGVINAENSIALTEQLNILLHKTNTLIVSLDHIHTIDRIGVLALTTLCRSAMRANKILTIIGKANKKINAAFGKDSYILRDDVF